MKIYDILFEKLDVNKKVDYIATSMKSKLLARAKEDQNAANVMHMGDDNATPLVSTLVKFDPTPNAEYLQFLTRMWIAGQFKFEDMHRIKAELTLFHKVKGKLANKDLNSYKDLGQLYDALAPYQDNAEEVMSNKERVKEIKKDAKKIIDTPEIQVIQPTTKEAACFYGKGTKWCTAATENSMFDHYHNQGPLYIITTRHNGKDRKFQLHYESGQFMDERDQEVPKKDIDWLSDLEGYTDFINYLMKIHYKPHIDAVKALEGKK